MIRIEKKIVGYQVRKPESTSKPGSATVAAPPPSPPVAPAVQSDERRLRLGGLPGIAQKSLKFPKRPTSVIGFQAWMSSTIACPTGKMSIAVSTHENGHVHPFEVWAADKRQPAEASLICELLSKVLHTDDEAFIQYHLDALKKARSTPFDLTLPSGEQVVAQSVGAAIALVYECYARRLGYLLHTDNPSPMLDAMSSRKEPKTNGSGGVATYDDVKNPATGDDFKLFVTEAWSDKGCMPLSIWLSGKQPDEADAICKLLSLAMRHRDPLWIAMALEPLRNHEHKGNALGWASAGGRKPMHYESTWAYVADLLLYRYERFGILDTEGRPVQQGSLFDDPDAQALGEKASIALSHLTCPECQMTGTMAMQGGCAVCCCGYSRCG